MIRKSAGKGYEVQSEAGKRLSKPRLSKTAAIKRLRQVEFWTAKKGKA